MFSDYFLFVCLFGLYNHTNGIGATWICLNQWEQIKNVGKWHSVIGTKSPKILKHWNHCENSHQWIKEIIAWCVDCCLVLVTHIVYNVPDSIRYLCHFPYLPSFFLNMYTRTNIVCGVGLLWLCMKFHMYHLVGGCVPKKRDWFDSAYLPVCHYRTYIMGMGMEVGLFNSYNHH